MYFGQWAVCVFRCHCSFWYCGSWDFIIMVRIRWWNSRRTGIVQLISYWKTFFGWPFFISWNTHLWSAPRLCTLFSLHMLPFSSILRKYQISFHCFVDNNQIYMQITSKSGSFQSFHNCLSEVKDWPKSNIVNLNENKTEPIVFGELGFPYSVKTCLLNFIWNSLWVKNLKVAHHKTCILDCQRQTQQPGANVALQQVDQSLTETAQV